MFFILRCGAGGLLFIGSAEATGTAQSLFSPVDAEHRLFVRRFIQRPLWKVPALPSRLPTRQRNAAAIQASTLPTMSRAEVDEAATGTRRIEGREPGTRAAILFGELHLKLLEHYGPPSVIVDEAHDIVHLSEHAGTLPAVYAGRTVDESARRRAAIVAAGIADRAFPRQRRATKT